MPQPKTRCFANKANQVLYAHYHDHEWGIPVHQDQQLFEMLILEGAQAGLSWETILKRREAYRKAFHQFDPLKVSKMTDARLAALCQDEGIIRNRLKIHAARQNARVFLSIQSVVPGFSFSAGTRSRRAVVGSANAAVKGARADVRPRAPALRRISRRSR